MSAGKSDRDAGKTQEPDHSTDAPSPAVNDRSDLIAQQLHRRPSAPASDNPSRKAIWQGLPARIAAVVVFLVALTTLLRNVLELRHQGSVDPPVATASPAPATTASSPATQAPEPTPAVQAPAVAKLHVGVDRIAVVDDGSPGTTDWRFTVEAGGEPLLAFQQDDLDDTAGRNIVRPKDAIASLRLTPGQAQPLRVKAWRLSRLRMQGTPDAVGDGAISGDRGDVAIRVQGKEPSEGSFVFYFAIDPR